jgi:hypothetical protein
MTRGKPSRPSAAFAPRPRPARPARRLGLEKIRRVPRTLAFSSEKRLQSPFSKGEMRQIKNAASDKMRGRGMRFCLITLGAFLLSCGVTLAEQTPEGPPQDVTYCQLAKDPSAFSGKRIRIRAIYAYMFEVSRLKSPTCCPERDVSIWVDFDEELKGRSQKLRDKFPKGMGLVLAAFVGRFEAEGPYGDGGYRFRLTVDQIEKIERTSRSPGRQNGPAWVPKNCKASSGLR